MTTFTTNGNNNGTTLMPTNIPSIEIPQIATIESNTMEPLQIPIVTCDLASDPSQNEVTMETDHQLERKDTLKVRGKKNYNQTSIIGQKAMTAFSRCRALSVGIDNDMISEFEPSSSDSGVARRCSTVKPRRFKLYQNIFNKNTQRNDFKQESVSEIAETEPALPKPQKPRDPEKEKRRIARKKEKRATLILGIIMGSFIACWLPFFFLYILIPACKKCKLPEYYFTVAFWLGYMNSALNPAIYTIFNKDFRRAFRRILFK